MSKPQIVIVDFGMGNLFSVQNALTHLGFSGPITQDPARVVTADGVILPGVGSFADAMQTLREHRLDRAISEFAASQKPLLGICLGAQLFLDKSFEFGEHTGLGLMRGTVGPLPQRSTTNEPLKVPHVGWNQISPPTNSSWSATALKHLQPGAFMYFVHSYQLQPQETSQVLATTTYGGHSFPSVIGDQNLLGCQFHPERSGTLGLEILKNFVATI